MSSEKHDFRVKLEDKKTGKIWNSGKNWDDLLDEVKKLRGKTEFLERKSDIIMELQTKQDNAIIFLLMPWAISKILKFIRNNPDVETRILHKFYETFEEPPLLRYVLYISEENMLKSKRIQAISQGPGKNRKWNIVKKLEAK